MASLKPFLEQSVVSSPETLATMYDLPSENPEEPGLPDEYHYLQPPLLSLTFRPPTYPADQVFSAGDMNLYYTAQQTQWYKRPDWFGVVGVPRRYDQRDLRLSYVIWQEGVVPAIIVELLSPGTEEEDLGQTLPIADAPPRKWEVYENILQVPYYVAYNRYTGHLQAFHWVEGQYQALELSESKVWMPNLQLGLGLWYGTYQGLEGSWLRWYDAQGCWIPTDAEVVEQERHRAEQEHQRAEQERQQKERLAEKLRSLGIDPNAL